MRASQTQARGPSRLPAASLWPSREIASLPKRWRVPSGCSNRVARRRPLARSTATTSPPSWSVRKTVAPSGETTPEVHRPAIGSRPRPSWRSQSWACQSWVTWRRYRPSPETLSPATWPRRGGTAGRRFPSGRPQVRRPPSWSPETSFWPSGENANVVVRPVASADSRATGSGRPRVVELPQPAGCPLAVQAASQRPSRETATRFAGSGSGSPASRRVGPSAASATRRIEPPVATARSPAGAAIARASIGCLKVRIEGLPARDSWTRSRPSSSPAATRWPSVARRRLVTIPPGPSRDSSSLPSGPRRRILPSLSARAKATGPRPSAPARPVPCRDKGRTWFAGSAVPISQPLPSMSSATRCSPSGEKASAVHPAVVRRPGEDLAVLDQVPDPHPARPVAAGQQPPVGPQRQGRHADHVVRQGPQHAALGGVPDLDRRVLRGGDHPPAVGAERDRRDPPGMPALEQQLATQEALEPHLRGPEGEVGGDPAEHPEPLRGQGLVAVEQVEAGVQVAGLLGVAERVEQGGGERAVRADGLRLGAGRPSAASQAVTPGQRTRPRSIAVADGAACDGSSIPRPRPLGDVSSQQRIGFRPAAARSSIASPSDQPVRSLLVRPGVDRQQGVPPLASPPGRRARAAGPPPARRRRRRRRRRAGPATRATP